MSQIRLYTVLALSVALLAVLDACGGGQSLTVPSVSAPRPTPAGGSDSTTVDNHPVSMKEFPLPPLTVTCACPADITVGSDGIIWFTTWSTIDSIDGLGNVHTYAPQPNIAQGGTASLVSAGDGALWFLTSKAEATYEPLVGRLTTKGQYTFFPPPQGSSEEGLFGMKRAPGNGVAYVGGSRFNFGHVYSTGPLGSLNFFAAYNDASPVALASGPDGLLYVAVQNFFGGAGCAATFCVQALAANHGAVITFPLQGVPVDIATVDDMVIGPDKNLWLIDSRENIIVRISTDGSGYKQFAVPTPNAGLRRIISAPDGALYFTEGYASKIGRITTQGEIKEFATPTGGSGPLGVTVCPQLCEGSHVRLWITESSVNKILRFEY